MNEVEESILEEFEKPLVGGAIAAVIESLKDHVIIFVMIGGTVITVILIRRRKRIMKSVRGMTRVSVRANVTETARVITEISHHF